MMQSSQALDLVDVAIIGAGLSGLAAGVRLAHFGKKVLIIERHNAPGGLNSFYSLNGRPYDVGLHAVTNYVPQKARGTPLMRLLRQLRISYEEFDLSPQKRSRIQFPGAALIFDNDFSTLEASIADVFPNSIDAFRRFVKELPLFDAALAHPMRATSGKAFLKSYSLAPELIDMLLCALCYYGSARPNDIDLAQLIILFRSIFMEGLGHPKEGIRKIIRSLLQRYRETGGMRRMKCGVQSILVKGKKVEGLLLENGEMIQARQILSSIGARETAQLLTEAPTIPFPPSSELSFIESVAYYPKSMSEGYWDETIVFYSEQFPFNYSCPQSLWDPQSGVICLSHNYQYDDLDGGSLHKEACLRVTALAHPTHWKSLSKESYSYEKAKAVQTLQKQAFKQLPALPHLGDNLLPEIASDSFTPKTIEHYTGHFGGSVYGSPQKYYDGQIGLENLLLCGTDQGLLGIVGAMLSGVIQSNQILSVL